MEVTIERLNISIESWTNAAITDIESAEIGNEIESALAFYRGRVLALVSLDLLSFRQADTHIQDISMIENRIEEINCNAWNCIYVTDKTLNDSTPKFLGEIRKNIRIACTLTPIALSEAALDFSIRIVSPINFTREQLINSASTNDYSLSLIETCLLHGQNVCISGAPFSGKTATMAYILSYLADNTDKRIATIEIEAREFNILRYDENGRPTNNVISWCTRESGNESYRITSDDLEELALRYNPQVIGVGEMRNKEALITCEIANTGITVISTTHADSAIDTYHRIVMLCKKAAVKYDDETLYRLVIKAFPVVAHQEFMQEGTHKITEIIEGVAYENGKIIYRVLSSFNISSSSMQLVTGGFSDGEGISKGLYKKLIKKGAAPALLERFREGE